MKGRETPGDWIDREPGFWAWVRELERVLRRAKARPMVTLLIAATLTAAIVAWRARHVPRYTATVVLRITESPFTVANNDFMAKGDLVDYVWSAVIAKPVALELIREHGLYGDLAERVPDLALDRFYGGLALREYRNYFLWGRDEGELRSARLAIEFVDLEAARAAMVAEDIARRVIEHEAERRRRLGEVALREATRAVDRARSTLEQREAEVLAKQRVLPADVESVKAYRMRLEQASAERERVELALGAEERALAPVIEIAHVDRPLAVERPPSFYAILGAVMFVFMLGGAAVGVGAFGAAVREPDDLQRLGIAAVGHIPRFRGSDAGSLKDRLRRRDR